MKAEIISIGSELTTGQNLDTNSQWLSQRFAEAGIAVGWHTTIADDFDDNVAAFQIATQRAGLVIATGGLGPTQDDLTREVLARVAGVELVFDELSFEQIRALFARFQRVMPERNRIQAMVPAGAEPIPNARGTAPGIWCPLGPSIVIAMPGVPSEMFVMFSEQVLPRLLRQGFGGGVLLQRKLNCFGAGESAVEQKLLDLTRRGHVPEVGITVSDDATISLRILARAADRTAALAQIEPVERAIRERLGNLLFGEEDQELQDVVGRLLAERGLTIATAESITCGLVANLLSRVPGASGWLHGGIASYVNDVKVQMLGVPPALLDAHTAVSAQVAEAMAVGCRSCFRTDLGLSTVGYAGPTAGGADKPVGTVFVGLASAQGVVSFRHQWFGTRSEIQGRTAKMALNSVRLHLLSLPQVTS